MWKWFLELTIKRCNTDRSLITTKIKYLIHHKILLQKYKKQTKKLQDKI